MTDHYGLSLRLPGYDYSQAGYYYVTICTFERQCLFGEVVENTVDLNETGQKAVSSHLIRQSYSSAFAWQDDFYDHIIRGPKDLARIRQYIVDNPVRWSTRQGENNQGI